MKEEDRQFMAKLGTRLSEIETDLNLLKQASFHVESKPDLNTNTTEYNSFVSAETTVPIDEMQKQLQMQMILQTVLKMMKVSNFRSMKLDINYVGK